jgi:hypothetical protein
VDEGGDETGQTLLQPVVEAYPIGPVHVIGAAGHGALKVRVGRPVVPDRALHPAPHRVW